ncbi:MAG: CCA tRNA nucleotidyltransferase [Prevotella sp.]|nr:CCA tRNA nucleotidyltransferase [Alistipes senegalensis]MCM1357612.1 CCA tRNA nucleotidyltransferase [Prevotella sp.]
MDKKSSEILDILTGAGFEAYLVGGCVRDTIMGRPFHDTDITTNALPEQITEVFRDYKTILTGMKHGTVTIISGGVPYEITTYRIDGTYSDSRRPDSVEFTSNLREDLARRDFTVNAIAMNSAGEISDYFGGSEDIKNGIIRCVGSPEKRFSEDALRIMRAIRFASQLGFKIEPETAKAVHKMKDRLKNISRERIREELDKLICGKNCVEVLMEYSDVLTTVIPEFEKCIGFEQHSPYHKYTVWEHIVRAVNLAPPDNVKMRRALLFHDIAKPVCARFDETGRGHFRKHAETGAEMTQSIMKNLRYDGNSITYAVTLIAHHSDKIITKTDVKKMMSVIGDNLFLELMEMKKCDNSAKNDFVLEENQLIDEIIQVGHRIIENNECRNLKNLDVNGNDLIKNGLHGAEIGEALQELLNLVMEEKLLNEHDVLINYIKQRCLK